MFSNQVIEEENYVQVTTEADEPVCGFKRRPKTPMKRSFLPEIVTEIVETEINQRLETNEVMDSFRAAVDGTK